MFASSLSGATLRWHPLDDPTGAWGLFLGEEVITEFAWSATPHLLYAGNLREGLALCREGSRFALVSHLDSGLGQWAGFDDSEGNGVVRVGGRVGGGMIWSEISITPAPAYRTFIERLLILWGGLQILRQRRPWLGLTASIATKAGVARDLRRLARDLA